MTFASTNRTALRFIPEASWGVTPGAGPHIALRTTGESLQFDITKETTAEMRPDAQVGYVIPTSAGSNGGINFELSYGEYDPFFAAALRSAWVGTGVNGVTALATTAAFAATTITFGVAVTGMNLLRQGQWFRMSKTGGANDGKLFRVHPTTAPTTTVITLDPLTVPVTESASAGYSLQTSQLMNDVLTPSFTIEAQHQDVAQFRTYRGMTVGQLDIDIQSAAKMTGSMTFMGQNMTRTGTTGMPGALTASRAYEVMSGAIGVGQLIEGGVSLNSVTNVKGVKLSINNNLRAQEALGNVLGYAGIGYGEHSVTGSFDAYFATGALLDKYIANTLSSMVFSAQDGAGNGYVFTLPKLNFTKVSVNSGSKNSDVMATVEFQALADDTNVIAANRKTIYVDRVGVALT